MILHKIPVFTAFLCNDTNLPFRLKQLDFKPHVYLKNTFPVFYRCSDYKSLNRFESDTYIFFCCLSKDWIVEEWRVLVVNNKMGGSMLTVIDSSFWQFTTDTIQYKQGSDLMIIKEESILSLTKNIFMWCLNCQNMENVSLKIVEKLQETKDKKKHNNQCSLGLICSCLAI